MSDAKSIRSPILRVATAFDWCLSKAVASLNALGTLIIIAMMVLICADVTGRNLFATSLPGVIELTELGIVSIVFLQIADTLKSGKLMRSDAVIKAIEELFPRAGAILNILFDATGVALFYFMANGAFGRFIEAWEGNFYLGNQGSFTVPTWPMELCVALGTALMCLLFIASAIRALSFLFGQKSDRESLNSDNEYK